jgi:hypothetical protein
MLARLITLITTLALAAAVLAPLASAGGYTGH